MADQYAIPADKKGPGGMRSADTEQDQPERISVLRNQHLVPLLSSYGSQPLRKQPWKGVLLERHMVQPGEIPEHEHPELCLHLQVSGESDFEWWSGDQNAMEHTKPGFLILIPPGTRDRLRWQGASERLLVSIHPSDLTSLGEDLKDLRPPEFRANWSLSDPELQRLVTEMGCEAKNQWPLGGLYSDLLAMGLKRRLLQSHATDPLKVSFMKGDLSLPKLKRAMEYINAKLAKDVRLEAVASELELSSSHFAHEFRNSTGQTPYQYLLEQRMSKAKDLLRTTSLPIQLISGQTGFNSPVNFVRAFRQRIGVTPEAWRKAIRT